MKMVHPCYFCGGATETTVTDQACYVECTTCHAQGPKIHRPWGYKSEDIDALCDEAEAKWNSILFTSSLRSITLKADILK